MFYPGQKVICVKDFGNLALSNRDRASAEAERRAGVVYPEFGDLYMVREVIIGMTYTGNVEALRLVEIVNPVIGYMGGADPNEIAFESSGFRPLIETDISEFHRLAEDAKRHSLEPV